MIYLRVSTDEHKNALFNELYARIRNELSNAAQGERQQVHPFYILQVNPLKLLHKLSKNINTGIPNDK